MGTLGGGVGMFGDLEMGSGEGDIERIAMVGPGATLLRFCVCCLGDIDHALPWSGEPGAALLSRRTLDVGHGGCFWLVLDDVDRAVS